MANKKLFKSLIGKMIPATDALNEERAPAYALAPKHVAPPVSTDRRKLSPILVAILNGVNRKC